MDGSDGPTHGISILDALQQGGEYAPFGTNDEPCETMVQSAAGLSDLSSNGTEHDAAEPIEAVDESFFDTASVGTDPNSTLFLYKMR